MRAIVVFLILALFGITNATGAEKTFKITTSELLPHVGAELENQGWAMEVAKAALELQGYKVSLELLPWARAVLTSKAGVYDGLYLAFYNEERAKWFVFSNPIGETRTGLCKIKGSDISFKTLQELKPYTIGIVTGAAVSEEFDKANFLKKDPVTTEIQNLKKLLLGRIDLYAGEEFVMKYFIHNEIPPEDRNKFVFISPPLAINKMYMAISINAPNYRQKLDDFNRGLEMIISDGTYDRILERHGLK